MTLKRREPIIVVLGLPRSGTSLMMQMLSNGGIDIHADDPHSGESEDIMKLPKDFKWLEKCSGKALKLLEPLEFSVPRKYKYCFIMLRRNILQQALSYKKFMIHLGLETSHPNYLNTLQNSLLADTINIWNKYSLYPGSKILVIDFERLITDTLICAEQIQDFLGKPLNLPKMINTVFPRHTDCLSYLMEYEFIPGAALHTSAHDAPPESHPNSSGHAPSSCGPSISP
jgi:LPS sulfotransferase NodH